MLLTCAVLLGSKLSVSFTGCNAWQVAAVQLCWLLLPERHNIVTRRLACCCWNDSWLLAERLCSFA